MSRNHLKNPGVIEGTEGWKDEYARSAAHYCADIVSRYIADMAMSGEAAFFILGKDGKCIPVPELGTLNVLGDGSIEIIRPDGFPEIDIVHQIHMKRPVDSGEVLDIKPEHRKRTHPTRWKKGQK